ncbi:hypothetical protein JW905_16170, partial [bacterium]|nr:hypothetical protein [candidate division CSSED10-310 bacterium]
MTHPNDEKPSLIHSLSQGDFGMPPGLFTAAEADLRRLLARLHQLQPLAADEFAGERATQLAMVNDRIVPRLFGTSGLRARVAVEQPHLDFIAAFVRGNTLTPLMAYA